MIEKLSFVCVCAYFFVPSDICLLDQFLSRYAQTNFPTFPRSYSHPTQPILQLYSHILSKIQLRLLYNHTHQLAHEQAPNERLCDYMIDGIYLFRQNMLARLRMCVFFCTFAPHSVKEPPTRPRGSSGEGHLGKQVRVLHSPAAVIRNHIANSLCHWHLRWEGKRS